MSHVREIIDISGVDVSTKISAADRKKAERERRKAEGLVAVTVYVDPADRWAIRATAAMLTGGGALARRVRNVLGLLQEHLPDKLRAKTQPRRFTPDQARKAVVVLLSERRK